MPVLAKLGLLFTLSAIFLRMGSVTFGGGLFYMGDWYASNDNLVRLDGFTRVDAMAAYRIGRYEIAFNVKNVLDDDYYESSNGNTQIMPAAGRNGLLSVRYRW